MEQEAVVLYEKRNQVAYITLNRPRSLNAINNEMHTRLLEIWRDFATDEESRVAVLTGKGRAFCSGADLREAVAAIERGEPTRDLSLGRMDTVETLLIPKPIICAINGPAAGGGVGYILDADIVICAEGADLVLPFAARGRDGGRMVLQLAKKTSVSAALWLCLSGQRIDAHTALRLGLVHEVVPAEELLPRATYLAERIASYSQLALRTMKDKLIKAMSLGFAEALRYRSPYQERLFASRDREEGPSAFVEKRRPDYGDADAAES